MELDKNTDRPLGIITDASSGIGYELAKQFAQHGFDLVIISENTGIVEVAQVCQNLGANVETCIVDLAEYDGVDELIERLQVISSTLSSERPVEAIAINADLGLAREVVGEISLDDEIRLIHLNTISSVHLAKYILREMNKRKRGRLLFTSVTSGIPEALKSLYDASKAFLGSYTDSLRNEVSPNGVTVTTMLSPLKEKENLTEMAQIAFEAMMNGRDYASLGDQPKRIDPMISKLKIEEGRTASIRNTGEPTKLKH